MPRPKKKENPNRISVYLSGDLYDRLQKEKDKGVSISDIVEAALRQYLETHHSTNLFGDLLVKNIEEGMTWEALMHKMNIHAPKDMVAIMSEHTIPTSNSRIYRIRGTDDWVLVDPGNAPSNIKFIFQRQKHKTQNKK